VAISEDEGGNGGGDIIRTSGITKKFDAVTALDDISLRIPAGATGLLGPNGAGKSTLIRVLIGLLEPTRGSGTVLGKEITTEGFDIRQRIGYMPEHECLILDMDAVAFCTFMGQMVGMPRPDALQRAHEVLHYIGVGEERYRKISTYSTGMRQKIKLAQALVHDPDLLLLDEPTNGLDPKGRDEMLALIRALAHDEKKNLLLSSHLLPDVEYVCDNVVIMSSGQILKQGNIKEMLIASKTSLSVRIKGTETEMNAFVSGLVNAGLGAEAEKGGNVRVEIGKEERLPEAYQSIMKAGSSAGCQVRFVSRSARSLEDLFLEVIVAQEKTGRASVSVVTGGAAAPVETGGTAVPVVTGGADAPGSKGGKT
jgi:ABC-2 type transport system ATP-binding protein